MNTIGTSTIGTSWRAKYFSKNLQKVLRNALVAEKVCQVDSSDSFYIHNPYGNQPSATVQALAGTYSVTAFTVTDDSLTVTDEVIFAEQVFNFEQTMNNYDLMANRMDEIGYAIATKIDRFVVNNLCEDGTGTYTTPAGGFTNAANINTIISNLCSKVMGYADAYNGLFLIIENTDVVGFMQAQMTNGFSYADAALNNGFMTSYAGVEIYVVRSGTFADETLGTKTYTNSGHRVFGVKNVATYASPRGIQYEEKAVSGKTGKEVAAYGYIGFKLWAQKAGLIVDITLA
jgi:hypothetical protein